MDDDEFVAGPQAKFAAEFSDEPPLTDLVPRAMATYRRGRRRRQVAGVGGTVAAVTAVALAATQLVGGSGSRDVSSAASSVAPPPRVSSGALAPSTRVASPSSPAASNATSSPSHAASTPCDQPLALQDAPDIVPVPNQTTAITMCRQGMATIARLLPGHTWTPAPDKFLQTPGTYLPYSYAADGDGDFPLAMSISTKPYFAATCANVWYPQTTCRNVRMADGTRGIEFDSLPSGAKPGGYQLDVDLPGGRQLQVGTGYQAGGPHPVTLDTFLALVKTDGFASWVKQYEALMGV